MIIPDSMHSIIDMDLARADMQVVAWDADCPRLKELFRQEKIEIDRAFLAGEKPDPEKDVHNNNVIELFGRDKYDRERKEGGKKLRDLSKKIGHAADYLVTPKRCAQDAGILVVEAERFIKRWFWINPEILKWHERIRKGLYSDRTVRNAFSYRRFFFGRLEDCLPEAVAWTPQSTIAIVINHALCNIDERLDKEVALLLQVHDSLVMQCLTTEVDSTIPLIREQSLIPIPYPDPLIIPVGFKTSEVSWGQVKEYVRKA